jgi:hypothetical protein
MSRPPVGGRIDGIDFVALAADGIARVTNFYDS